MSGAFVKFKGLKNPKPKRLGEPFYAGIPCLYSKHSGIDGSLRVTRDSLTHSCVECEETIRQGLFSLDITRLAKKYRSRALKFWSKVDIGEWDECWRWTAEPISGQLYYIWPRAEIKSRWGHHPIQVMMWLTWGDTGRLGSTSLCGERRCMNPLHNLPLDIRHSARIEDYDPLWLDEQLTLLRMQVQEYQELKTTKDLKASDSSRSIFDPTKPQDLIAPADTISETPTPYQLAYAELLQSYQAD